MSEKDIVLIGSLKEKVVNRIKESFTDLIPDEAWDILVETDVKKFLETDLRKLINEELKNICGAKLKEELSKPEYNDSNWGPAGSQMPSTAVKEIIKELTPDFIAALIGGIVREAAQVVRNQLNQNNQF